MALTNMAKGRKGEWWQKNATRWDRKENKAREAEARARAEFVHEFIFSDDITIEDTARLYCAGMVREFPAKYSFTLKAQVDEFLGVMAYGRLIAN